MPDPTDEETREGNGDAREAARTAREQGRETADAARERALDVGEVARGETGDAVDTAKDEAGRVAEEAATQASSVVTEATERLHQQARHQTGRAAESLRRTGSQVEALADGRPQEAGPMEGYARRAASHVTRVADHVETQGFDGLVDDVEGFARRRPGAFLLSTAAAGFLVGRLGRNRTGGSA